MCKAPGWGEQERARARQVIKEYYHSEQELPFRWFTYTPLGLPLTEVIATATLSDGTEETLVLERTSTGDIVLHPMEHGKNSRSLP